MQYADTRSIAGIGDTSFRGQRYRLKETKSPMHRKAGDTLGDASSRHAIKNIFQIRFYMSIFKTWCLLFATELHIIKKT